MRARCFSTDVAPTANFTAAPAEHVDFYGFLDSGQSLDATLDLEAELKTYQAFEIGHHQLALL